MFTTLYEFSSSRSGFLVRSLCFCTGIIAAPFYTYWAKTPLFYTYWIKTSLLSLRQCTLVFHGRKSEPGSFELDFSQVLSKVDLIGCGFNIGKGRVALKVKKILSDEQSSLAESKLIPEAISDGTVSFDTVSEINQFPQQCLSGSSRELLQF